MAHLCSSLSPSERCPLMVVHAYIGILQDTSVDNDIIKAGLWAMDGCQILREALHVSQYQIVFVWSATDVDAGFGCDIAFKKSACPFIT